MREPLHEWRQQAFRVAREAFPSLPGRCWELGPSDRPQRGRAGASRRPVTARLTARVGRAVTVSRRTSQPPAKSTTTAPRIRVISESFPSHFSDYASFSTASESGGGPGVLLTSPAANKFIRLGSGSEGAVRRSRFAVNSTSSAPAPRKSCGGDRHGRTVTVGLKPRAPGRRRDDHDSDGVIAGRQVLEPEPGNHHHDRVIITRISAGLVIFEYHYHDDDHCQKCCFLANCPGRAGPD